MERLQNRSDFGISGSLDSPERSALLISAVREGHAAFCSAGSQPCAAFARISSYLPKKHLCIRQIVACIRLVIFVLRAAFKEHFVLFYQRLERFDDAVDLSPFHISFLIR